jgi:TPR repeat protein
MARRSRRKSTQIPEAAAEPVAETVEPIVETVMPPADPQLPAETVMPSLDERVAKLETRPADAWLERRLRVFEHTLSDLQTRQEQVERNSAAAAGLLERTLAEVKQAIGDADQRQREAMKSLRSAVVGVSSRMEGVEVAIRSGVPNPSESFVPEAEPVQAPDPEPAQPIDSGHGARAEPQSGNASFIAAARSAAKAAAEQPRPARKRHGLRLPRLLRRLKRAQLLMIGGAALLVLFATVGAVLSKTVPQAAAAEPARQASSAATRHETVQMARENARAEFETGLKYLSGEGAPKNARIAALWFGRAGHAGNALAQYELGAMFRHGIGVAADAAKSLRWYAMAAEQGNRKAMYDLATAFAQGWGTDKNFAQATGWYARAAGLGNVDAAFNLAVLYERGDGVPQSLIHAYEWYVVAASEGDGQSATRAGVLETQLAPGDVASAQHWVEDFKPAAMNADANAVPHRLAAN